jgi:hypothetical protein
MPATASIEHPRRKVWTPLMTSVRLIPITRSPFQFAAGEIGSVDLIHVAGECSFSGQQHRTLLLAKTASPEVLKVFSIAVPDPTSRPKPPNNDLATELGNLLSVLHLEWQEILVCD